MSHYIVKCIGCQTQGLWPNPALQALPMWPLHSLSVGTWWTSILPSLALTLCSHVLLSLVNTKGTTFLPQLTDLCTHLGWGHISRILERERSPCKARKSYLHSEVLEPGKMEERERWEEALGWLHTVHSAPLNPTLCT